MKLRDGFGNSYSSMIFHQVFGALAVLVAIASFFPYLGDVLERRTTPHMYSWLIWAVLQLTAAIAILQENTLWSAAGTGVIALVSLLVFLLSFKYGTKNITRFDAVCLIGALVSILIWVFLDNVTLSIILVTIIDLVGFLPTFRKAIEEPYSETLILYVCSALSNLFSILAITQYSLESSLYVASLVVTNAVFVGVVLLRRRVV